MAGGHGGKRNGAGAKKGVAKSPETKLLREAVLVAATNVGKTWEPKTKDGLVTYLEKQAVEQPSAFMGLLGRVMPLQLNHADNEGEKLEGFKVILVGKAG